MIYVFVFFGGEGCLMGCSYLRAVICINRTVCISLSASLTADWSCTCHQNWSSVNHTVQNSKQELYPPIWINIFLSRAFVIESEHLLAFGLSHIYFLSLCSSQVPVFQQPYAITTVQTSYTNSLGVAWDSTIVHLQFANVISTPLTAPLQTLCPVGGQYDPQRDAVSFMKSTGGFMVLYWLTDWGSNPPRNVANLWIHGISG